MAVKPSLFKKLRDLKCLIPHGRYREAFGDFIDEIDIAVPEKMELPSYLKSYEDSRKWKHSAEEALHRGEQVPVPNVKGDIAKDKAIMSYNRHNKGVDELNDFVDKSPIVYELGMGAEEAAKWDKEHIKEVNAAMRHRDLMRSRSDEIDKMYLETFRDLEKRRKELSVKIVDANLDDPVMVKKLSEEYGQVLRDIDNLNEQYRNDNMSLGQWQSIPINPYEEKYFDDIDIESDYVYEGIRRPMAQTLLEQIREYKNTLSPVESAKPSNQKFVRRFHTTNKRNIPSIMEEGLDPRYSGTGYGDQLVEFVDPELYDGVYMTAEAPWLDVERGVAYTPNKHEYTLEYMIPKEEYKNLPRLNDNVEGSVNSLDKSLETVQRGGRTDIFQSRIKPEWLVNIFDGDMKSVDFNNFKK